MAFKFCGRKLLVAKASLRTSYRHQGYIVLIPEIGEDLPEKNPLLQQNGLPEFNNITIENCMAAIGKQTIEFENDIRELETKIASTKSNNVFKDVIETLDLQGNSLDMTWGLSKTLYLGHSTKMPTKNYLAIHERAKRARAAKYNSKMVYEAALNELNNTENTSRTEEQTRIIKKFALEGKLNGLSLSTNQQERLIEVLNKLNKEKGEFKMKVENSTNGFTNLVEDPAIVKEMPDSVKESIAEPGKAESGPWKVTLHRPVAIPFIEYCPDRMLRWNIWQAMVGRGSGYSKRDLETSTHLEQIRGLRHDEANILGYKTYADMSMETKMAGSVDNVNNMIKCLLESAYPSQEQELKSLLEFAHENGFEGKQIELWDLPYWRRKQKTSLLKFDEAALRNYFQFNKVIGGLYDICQSLFHIRIVPRTNVSTWHKNVQYFDIFDSNGSKPIAGFYLDPYVIEAHNKTSQHNAWMVGIQNKSLISSTMPLAALVFNFKPPSNDGPSLLSFDEVKLVFNKFGQALQHLLTRTTYSEVSGLSNIEWDAVEVPGHVLTHFLHNKQFLDRISSHVHSNENISDEMFSSIVNAHRHMAGTNLSRELYLSALDMELYTSRSFWLDIVKKLWPQYRAFPLDKYDSHPCSFTQIFSEEWAAAYYCHIWSRVIAADVYSAFSEATTSDKMTEVGQRYRDTFLALGGACHSSQVFRKFRGRDPSPAALLRSYGLQSRET